MLQDTNIYRVVPPAMRRLTQEDHRLREAVHRWMDNNAHVVFDDAESAALELKEMVESWCCEWIEDEKEPRS